MKMLVRPLLFALGFAVVRLGAQVAGPSPLAPDSAAERAAPGGWIAAEQRADQALATGFSATAAGIYRGLLMDRSLPTDIRQRVGLSQITALMESGDTVAAEQALQDYDGPRRSAYQLRAGLLALANRRTAQARAALAAGKPDELSDADRGWWYFLQAEVAYAEGDAQANALYEQAERAAVSELQRARFVLGQEQARLRTGPVNEAQLNTLRGNMERFQGQRTGYEYARSYAAALFGLGRSLDAQVVLDRQLSIIPSTERKMADQFRLMKGLIAGERSQTGRQAFRQLLREAQLAETQQIALQLLVRGATTPAERDQLRRDLTELIGAPVQHQIIEDLLLTRAQLELADKLYAPAEEDARALLERYPGSKLKPSALGVRLAVAWDLKRYRAAADVIAQLRSVIDPAVSQTEAQRRAELGVLLAEAWFRAGADAETRGADGKSEFRNAADAYEAALHEAPLAAPAGVLIFQRAVSEIKADRLEAAAKQLDEAAAGAGFDAVNRWQAEWNLIKEMQVRGQTVEAAARVEKLLAGGTAAVPEELRIRLMWLRAKLSFDNGQPDAALRQADELLAMLPKATQLDEALRTNVTSTTQLLKAQALLAREHDAEGVAILDKLRADYHATSAAQYSYLVQAGHLTQRGDLAGAQRVLINFVDTAEYRRSEYAPLALYQAALLLERQGLDRQLQEAYKLLERLVHDYPGDDLIFRARLKQGDLMRKLNDFGTARQLYEDLINNYSQHPDVLLAQLALADTLFAQGANNLTNYESAATIFERLRDLPSAPVDLRAEAGFKWGYALAKRGQAAKAQAVFWSVVDSFLLDPTQAAKLGATGRWWVSKSLLELAQIHEDAGRLDEAQRAYQLIVDNKLSGLALAQSKLARFRPAPAPTP